MIATNKQLEPWMWIVIMMMACLSTACGGAAASPYMRRMFARRQTQGPMGSMPGIPMSP